MKRTLMTGLTALALTGAGLMSALADDTPDTEQAAVATTASDPGFAGLFDGADLAAAISAQNAGAIADQALKLAEGERILLRGHASGVSPETILALAARVAAETGDTATLDRLAQAAEAGEMDGLKTQVEAARQLAQSSRSATGPKVAIDDVDSNALMVYSMLMDDIATARALSDRAALENIRDTAADYADLSDDAQAAVKAAATEALAGLPEQTDDATAALQQLAGASRLTSAGTLAISTVDGSAGGTISIEQVLTSAGKPGTTPPRPVSRCNLKNPSTTASVTFNCVGTGKAYTLKPGQSMNFIIYGKYIPPSVSAPPPTAVQPGTLAISTSIVNATVTPGKIIPPYLKFSKVTPPKTIKGPFGKTIKLPGVTVSYFRNVPSGNFNIVLSNGNYVLKRR